MNNIEQLLSDILHEVKLFKCNINQGQMLIKKMNALKSIDNEHERNFQIELIIYDIEKIISKST